MNDGILEKLKTFYEKYYANQKINLEVPIIKYMIKFRTHLISLHGTLPNKMYERLNNTRLRSIEEEKKFREHDIHKFFVIYNDEQLYRINKKLNPLWRDKMREIRLMSGLYEEVREEIEKVVYEVLSQPCILQPTKVFKEHPQQDTTVMDIEEKNISTDQVDDT